MKVLITGGKGPLESAIVQELSVEHQVYLMGVEPVEMDVEFIQGDIFDVDAVQQAVKGMEAIIHLWEPSYDAMADAEEREQRALDFATRGSYYLMQAAEAEGRAEAGGGAGAGCTSTAGAGKTGCI